MNACLDSLSPFVFDFDLSFFFCLPFSISIVLLIRGSFVLFYTSFSHFFFLCVVSSVDADVSSSIKKP